MVNSKWLKYDFWVNYPFDSVWGKQCNSPQILQHKMLVLHVKGFLDPWVAGVEIIMPLKDGWIDSYIKNMS